MSDRWAGLVQGAAGLVVLLCGFGLWRGNRNDPPRR